MMEGGCFHSLEHRNCGKFFTLRVGQCHCYPQNAMVRITRWDAGELENFNYEIPCGGCVSDSTT